MLLPPYEALSRFAGNLATCLEAGVELRQALVTSTRGLGASRIGPQIHLVLERVEAGSPLSESLAVAGGRLPPFFIPMIEAGELTGRLDESLRYLERHCRMLARPALAVRNAWMFPLAIMVGGSIVRIVLHLVFAPWAATAALLFQVLSSYSMLVVMAVLILKTPLRFLFRRITLEIPLLGSVERDMAANRFFHALAMLYAAAGRRVESMIRFAAGTVGNPALRTDFLRAGRRVETGDAIPESFESCRYLSREQKELIETGDVSGTLERSFERIAGDSADRLQRKLAAFQQVAARIMIVFVGLSLASTIAALLQFL